MSPQLFVIGQWLLTVRGRKGEERGGKGRKEGGGRKGRGEGGRGRGSVGEKKEGREGGREEGRREGVIRREKGIWERKSEGGIVFLSIDSRSNFRCFIHW